MTTETADLGLALSGGGSRAAAFHRGTLRALDELGLVPRVQTISSVSGGSVFAAAWMAARAREQSDEEFLAWMRGILARGFVRPAVLHWRALKVLWPWWSRTQRLAETFDEVLFEGVGWDDLPERPLLCLNTTVLNNAASGRFSRGGYSCKDVGRRTEEGYPEGRVKGVTIGLATAASAAFPFGLPPLSIARARFAFSFEGELAGHSRLVLTDGGIVENLGVERLLQSKRFGTRHVIASDAGVRDRAWQPGGPIGRLRSAVIFALSSNTLERLLHIMNSKQSRSMRQLMYARLVHERDPDLDRKLLFVRLEQDWDRLLRELPQDAVAKADLDRAREIYKEMGSSKAAADANEVVTGFTGLGGPTLDLLEAHARWQVHALMAVFGKGLLPSVG